MDKKFNEHNLEEVCFHMRKLFYTDEDTPKIYLSGPVSKFKNDEYALSIFNDYEKKLKKYIEENKTFNKKTISFEGKKPIIVNPVAINMSLYEMDKMDWGDFMTFDIMILNQCNYIFMLNDWISSKGAWLEKQFAKDSGKITLLENDTNLFL